ncbi:ATP-binding protein [Sulfolobus sp. B5]|nr:ATP-binding protein [Sulfolobus sp. B5]
MYEYRHVIANVILISLIMMLYVSLSSMVIPIATPGSFTSFLDSSLLNSFSLFILSLVLISVSSVIFALMFSSIIIAILYYITLFAFASIVYNNFVTFSTLLDLSPYYFGILAIVGIILGLTRRSFPDEVVLNLSRIKISINRKKVVIGVIVLLISLFIFYFISNNLLLLIGSIVGYSLYLTICEENEFPLILLSWFSIPYMITHSIRFETDSEGIELGKVEGVLSPTLTNRFSQTKYGWKKVSGVKFNLNLAKSKNYNIVIIGTSGSGKSSLAKLLLEKTNLSYLVFDLHGEYNINNANKIDISRYSLNPLSLNGSSPRQRSLEISYMLKSLFKLGSLQTIDIFNIIMETYAEKGVDENNPNTWNSKPPTFHDVLITMERKKKLVETSQDVSRIQSIEPYIQFLSNQMLNGNSIDMDYVFDNNIILDLSKVPTDELKYILIETILRDFRSYLYKRGQSALWKFVVIDEAPFILSKETGLEVVERLFAEVRKFGVGIILISQLIDHIENILQNSDHIFIFNVIEPKELEYLSRTLGGGDQDKYRAIYQAIQYLDRAHVVTVTSEYRDILLVKLNSLK